MLVLCLADGATPRARPLVQEHLHGLGTQRTDAQAKQECHKECSRTAQDGGEENRLCPVAQSFGRECVVPVAG